jgi:hypothetical protein
MLSRTSVAIYVAAAVIGAAIPLYVLYYHPVLPPGEGRGFFADVCGVSTFPATWLLVHILPDKYFYDYFWLTPPPDLGPQWLFVLEFVVMNAVLWIAACFVVMFLVRLVRRRQTVSGASNHAMERTSDRSAPHS